MIRSIFSNWCALLVNGVIALALTPFLIHGLGHFYFGLWSLAASLLGYYGLLDLGMRTTLFRFVARFKGAGHREALNQTLSSALAVTVCTGLFIWLSTAILSIVLPDFLGLREAHRGEFRTVFLLLGTGAGLIFPARLLGAYLNGLGRFDFYSAAGMACGICRALLIVAALRLGYGVFGVGLVELIVTALSLLLNYTLVRIADRELSLSWRLASWRRVREMAGFSLYVFLAAGGEQIRLYTSSLVIARVLGVPLLTPFNVVIRLMEYFKSLVVALGGPLLGVLCELDGQRKSGEFREMFLRSTKFTFFVCALIGALFLLNGEVLLTLWLGPELASAYPILAILAIGYAGSLAQQPANYAPVARGRHRPLAYLTLAEAGATLALSVIWAPGYGLGGVAAAIAGPMIVSRAILQPWYVLRLLHIPAGEYCVRALLRPLAVLALFMAISRFALMPQAAAGIVSAGCGVAAQVALFAGLVWTLGLNRSERRIVAARVPGFAQALFSTRRANRLPGGIARDATGVPGA